MDDGVQRVKVQGTTCRKNKQNERVHKGRKDSGKKIQEEKELGVMVHKAMNGSRQVTEAVKKPNSALAQLRTITKEIDTVIPTYKATVRPHLEYCVQAWAPYLKDINALEKVSIVLRIEDDNNIEKVSV